MQKNAYALLNLGPEQFWSLTLKEYNLMMEGYIEKAQLQEELEWRRTAQQTAWLMNMFSKRKITVDNLLEKPKKATESLANEEDVKELAEELGIGMNIQ